MPAQYLAAFSDTLQKANYKIHEECLEGRGKGTGGITPPYVDPHEQLANVYPRYSRLYLMTWHMWQ